MKVLVTGAAGFLGTRISERLLAAGVTDLRLHFRSAPAARIAAWSEQYPAAKIESIGANLLARDGLDRLVAGVDCMIHAAAGMRGSAADMFANTVVGTRNLLDAAGAAGVKRIVLISSFAVYRTVDLADGAVHDESLPIEATGTEKGSYAYTKTRQEQLFEEYRKRLGFESVILRPGAIYGPGTSPFSTRVGISAAGFFFALGGRTMLPLSYVENCADAIVEAALNAPAGSAYNVVDDDLPTCREYLDAFRREVRRVRTLPVPYWALMAGSRFLAHYNRKSKGQLPAVFPPYVVRSMYRPLHYSNAALKNLGWRQRVSTADALALSFKHWREHEK